MDTNLIAQTSVTVEAPKSKVWDTLVNPEAIKQYYFGTNAVSHWLGGRESLRANPTRTRV